jgi:hypothetical protein
MGESKGKKNLNGWIFSFAKSKIIFCAVFRVEYFLGTVCFTDLGKLNLPMVVRL